MSARTLLFWPYRPEDVRDELGYGPEHFTIIGTNAMRNRAQTSIVIEHRETVAYDPLLTIGGVYEAVVKHHRIRLISGRDEVLRHISGRGWVRR